MRPSWNRIVPPIAAGAALTASLGLGGCGRPASQPTAPTPPPAAGPTVGTRTAVLAVKGMV